MIHRAAQLYGRSPAEVQRWDIADIYAANLMSTIQADMERRAIEDAERKAKLEADRDRQRAGHKIGLPSRHRPYR